MILSKPTALAIFCSLLGSVASAAASSNGDHLTRSLFLVTDRQLHLRGDQKTAVQSILSETSLSADEIYGQEKTLWDEAKSQETQLYRIFFNAEIFPDDPGRSSDQLRLSEGQTKQNQSLIDAAIAARKRRQQEAASLSRQEGALWRKTYSKIYAILDPDQKKAFDVLKDQLDDTRYAEIVHDYLTSLADNPGLLGSALTRLSSVRQARNVLVDPLLAALKSKDAASLRRLLAGNVQSSAWNWSAPRRSDHIVKEYALRNSEILRGPAVIDDIQKFLAEYSSIEGCDLDLFGVDLQDGRRVFTGLFSLRGLAAAERKRMETTAALTLTASPDGKTIEKITLADGKKVVAVKDSLFDNKTLEAGLLKIPSYLRSEAIRRGGYALAMNDSGKVGNLEMYVGAVKGGMLLRDDGLGHFSDVTQEAGLGDDTLVKAAVFADFNNSGKDDLLLVRFEYDPTKQFEFYKGLGAGKYALAGNFHLPNPDSSLPMPIAVGDFNGDQKLDLYVGFPGKLDFTTMDFEKTGPLASKEYAAHRQPQGLFLNTGNYAFSNNTVDLLKNNEDWANPRLLFPHSAIAADFNNDGHTDLIVADDRQSGSPIYRNRGDGTFDEVSGKIAVQRADYGMSAAIGDFNNDGNQGLYLTNIYFPSTFAMQNYTGWLRGEPSPELDSPGNHLYRNKGDGTFEDVTDRAGVRFAGAAPGGAEFFDFDNDGYLDLYVTNGLWSAGPQAKSFDDTFLLAALAQRKIEGMWKLLGQEGKTEGPVGLIEDAFPGWKGAMAMLGMLKNYLDENGKPAYSFGGNQRNRLFHNNGDGTFTDVGYVAGVDSASDGYVVAIADVNHDGSPDIILRNADPGTAEHTYPTVELFLNNAGKDKRHLDLRLTGTNSNRDAVGAKVTIEQIDGRRQNRELIANNGAAQSEKYIHFGLNDDARVAKLSVRWPSGKVQDFSNVRAGNYRLTEGLELERADLAGVFSPLGGEMTARAHP